MRELELTLRMAHLHGVEGTRELDTIFAVPVVGTEWSFNDRDDRRGTFRVSVWTNGRSDAKRVIERHAPWFLGARESLLGNDLEGLGLAFRPAAPPSFRWWSLSDDGERTAAAVRRLWHAQEVDDLFATVGGRWACTAVGVELDDGLVRATVYARLVNPEVALRLLEQAGVQPSRRANLFFRGMLGLETPDRPWPRVWVGRSLGAPDLKFYYFAAGDDHRRSDAVLLDAIEAGPTVLDSWRLLGDALPGPRVSWIALRFSPDQPPAWTAYLTSTSL